MEHSESIKQIAAALAKAQSVMHGATKDRTNPAFKTAYATLQSVIEAARGPLNENGISFLQSPGAIDDNTISITTTLLHESGEWLRERFCIPFEKRTPQSVGSAISYGRRYALMSFLGMPAVDDDGEAAMPREQPKPSTKPHRLEPKPPQLDDDAPTLVAAPRQPPKTVIDEIMETPTESQERIYKEAIAAVVKEKTLAGLGAVVALHENAVKDCTDKQWNDFVQLVKTRRVSFKAFPGEQQAAIHERTGALI
jgi:hypothetical protein